MSDPRKDPPPDTIRAEVTYDSANGDFVRCATGAPATTPGSRGYRVVTVKQRRYLAHRLAWFFFYGEWPTFLLDHIDGNRANNAIGNLRRATTSQNAQNRARPRGRYLRGVTRRKGRFQANIHLDGKTKSIGYFVTEAEAHSAYRRVAISLFGEFARLD